MRAKGLPFWLLPYKLPSLQEGKLVERESSTWRLRGEPTVLITMAYIFNHFAPLMVSATGFQSFSSFAGGPIFLNLALLTLGGSLCLR